MQSSKKAAETYKEIIKSLPASEEADWYAESQKSSFFSTQKKAEAKNFEPIPSSAAPAPQQSRLKK
jgi:hypothetical protein